MTLFGLGKPDPSRFPYAGRPQPSPGVAPSSGQVIRARQVIIFGAGGGLFVYSGTPALGNLIASITATAGTDPYGNHFLPGVQSYIPGGQSIALEAGALVFYTPAGAAYAALAPFGSDVQFTVNPLIGGGGGLLIGGNPGTIFYGPSGDATGATDAVAINRMLAAGYAVQLIPGTYWINAPLILRTGSVLRGCGHGVTFIKMAAASNCPAVQTLNFASLTGTGSLGGAGQFQVTGITFHGNSANQTVPAAAIMQVYGYDYVIDDVDMTQFLATDGLWTEWGTSGYGPGPTTSIEARWTRMRVIENTLTGAGWRNRGPHDSQASMIFIAFNTAGPPPWAVTAYKVEQSSGLYSGGACIIDQMHCYGNHGIQYDLQASGKFSNCTAEGASGTQVLIESGDFNWTGGWIFPGGAAGGAGITFGSAGSPANGFIISGTEIINFAGTSAATAALNFVNSGPGRIDALIYQPTGQAIWGSTANTQVEMNVSYAQTNEPSFAAGPALGTGPPAPTGTNGDDNRGLIGAGTGTAPTIGLAVSVTFQQPRDRSANVVIWPANGPTAALLPYLDGITATGFGLGFQVAPAASQAAGTYQVGYAVIG